MGKITLQLIAYCTFTIRDMKRSLEHIEFTEDTGTLTKFASIGAPNAYCHFKTS